MKGFGTNVGVGTAKCGDCDKKVVPEIPKIEIYHRKIFSGIV